MPAVKETLHNIGAFSAGIWRYWRRGEPTPDSNFIVQKLYAYTDGRSNDVLFRILDSKRREEHPIFDWEGTSLESHGDLSDSKISETVRTLKQDGVTVLPVRVNAETVQGLQQLAKSGPFSTTQFGPLPTGLASGSQSNIPIASRGTSDELDLTAPSWSVYDVRRSSLLANPYLQALLCDPYLLTVATRYLGVFPVVTKPDMWWDTDFIPAGLRPRPFHVDSGCLRWLKVGINLTDTTTETPHFVYVKGSHNPNKQTRPLTRRLTRSMNLSDQEVLDFCPEKITHVTGPAGSIMLADTRGIHKGELSSRGHRLILYFGLEGSAFNNIDKPIAVDHVETPLRKAMSARPFSYQFFKASSSHEQT